jgi:hypothetical protein
MKQTHSHIDPRNYKHTTKGSLIVTTCKVCGKWIGNRPKDKETSK